MFKLDENSPEFFGEFKAFIHHKRSEESNVQAVVRDIIQDVMKNGDEALMRYSLQFDKHEITDLEFSAGEIEDAIAKVSKSDKAALELAATRIKDYHSRQKPKDADYTDDVGARLGWRFTPIATVGIYVPGGLASYPSSVLMNAIPAKVAGVTKVVMCVPCPNGEINPLVIYAASIAGVDHIFKIGGAQAVAAMAYGTHCVPAVDKITGPGNAYVAEAKRQVFGHVGIDMIAGPSEVLIIADHDNNPDWIAVDLLSQAEHDADAQAILITNSADLATSVEAAINNRLETLERREIARASWNNHGAIILAKSLQSAAHLSNMVAPEHLQICTKDARALSHLTHHAGAIFLGKWTPEAIGDYVGGPNHVLPTSRSARFSSGLNLFDFIKRTTISEMDQNALLAIGPSGERLAKSEGLAAHALSIRLRLDEKTLKDIK